MDGEWFDSLARKALTVERHRARLMAGVRIKL